MHCGQMPRDKASPHRILTDTSGLLIAQQLHLRKLHLLPPFWANFWDDDRSTVVCPRMVISRLCLVFEQREKGQCSVLRSEVMDCEHSSTIPMQTLNPLDALLLSLYLRFLEHLMNPVLRSQERSTDTNCAQCGPRVPLSHFYDTNGHEQTRMDMNRHERIRMDTNGHGWTRMDTNGHEWTRTDTNGHEWTRMDTKYS
ncbi:hypothetical protein EV361DRAFT_401872 [Lentinula raphanica]|nr:hypothetical protein EV361DRAFT_401872 [Lentinula raphanica]